MPRRHHWIRTHNLYLYPNLDRPEPEGRTQSRKVAKGSFVCKMNERLELSGIVYL